jgi:hypothetical protein
MKDNRRPLASRQAAATQRRAWSPLLKRIQPDASVDRGTTSHYVAVPEVRAVVAVNPRFDHRPAPPLLPMIQLRITRKGLT